MNEMNSELRSIVQGSRRCLVVVRAGDNSLHPAWLDPHAQDQRLWDLHLSYYGTLRDPFPDRPSDVTLSFERGTSFCGLADCFKKAPFRRPLDSYDWIWLPDDDLLMDQQEINAFFRYVMKYDLKLAQPALHETSYVAHVITSRHSGSLLRFTDFVEVMCPSFSRRALKRCLPYFRETISSWGLDFLFPKLLGYPPRSIAIVDAAVAVHTRKIRTGLHYDRMREAGKDPWKELDELIAKYGLSFQRRNNLAAVKLDGMVTDDLTGIVPVHVPFNTQESPAGIEQETHSGR
jgi:uncharacterized protein DUF707